MSADNGPFRVVLATDSMLIGDGLESMLTDVDDIEVIGRARHHNELPALVASLNPDALIISIRSPVSNAMATIESARHLRDNHPDLGLVVISDLANGFALELLRGGASGVAYLLDGQLPSIDTVVGALRDIRNGQTVLDPSIVDDLLRRGDGPSVDDLTVRETEVLHQLSQGLSNKSMAHTLHLSLKSIEKNVTLIFRKLGLDDPSLLDRRVTAGLMYQRSQTSPIAEPYPSVAP